MTTTNLTGYQAWRGLTEALIAKGIRTPEQIATVERTADADVIAEYGEWALGRGRSEGSWIVSALIALNAQGPLN